MDDFTLSSCSFLMETDDNGPETEVSQTEIQNIILQNERLQEVNKQLQSSLENVRTQLSEALTAASSNGLTEQIQTLKIQLNESNEKREKLSQELKFASEHNENNNEKLLKQISAITAERDALSEEIRRSNEQKSKLKNERQTLRYELEEKQEALESVVGDMMKLKQQKSKQQQKNAASSAALRELEDKNSELSAQCEKITNEKAMLKQEIDELKLKLANTEQINNELKNNLETIKAEKSSNEEAISVIENQLEKQRQEMDDIAKEKQKIIVLLQKMSSALSASEIKIESLEKEKNSLSLKRTLKQNQRTSIISKTDILDLKIPFEGELGDDCEKIIKLPQYQPMQRIQLIFNEAARRVTEVEEEIEELKNTKETSTQEYNEVKENASKYQQILVALLKDLKEISISERNIIKISDCNNDGQFINYMADKCAQLEPMLREKVLSDPHFISDDFFFTEDLTKRKMEIQSICELSDSAFAILTAQFIINTLLQKQVNTLMLNNEEKKETAVIDREIPQPVEEQREIPNQELQEKLQKATKIAKQLKAQLKKSQQVQMDLQQKDSDQKTKIAQLQIQNDDLKNQVEVAKLKLQVAPNESNDQSIVSSYVSQIKESFEEQKKESETNAMQEELRRKTEECAHLNQILKKTQEAYDSTLQSKTKQYKKKEEAMKREIISLSEQIDALTQQMSMKKKQQKKKERINAQHQEQTINEITKNYEETKANLNLTIETLTEKVQKAHEMSQKLMGQISECEQRNQQLISENTQFSSKQRKIQMELTSMKQQINKERQHLQGQLSAQMMAYETKIQKTQKEAKEDAEKRVNELLSIVHDALNDLYGLDESEFNEDAFKQLVAIVKNDLDKLQYFQNEATKFSFDVTNE